MFNLGGRACRRVLADTRVLELCELTHLSIRRYQRRNGEVVALLVVLKGH